LESFTPKLFSENNSNLFGLEQLFAPNDRLDQLLPTSGLSLTTTEIKPQPIPLTPLS
jgi:hypothetical protein